MQAIVNHGVAQILQIAVQVFQEAIKIRHDLILGNFQILIKIGSFQGLPDHGAENLNLAGVFTDGHAVICQ